MLRQVAFLAVWLVAVAATFALLYRRWPPRGSADLRLNTAYWFFNPLVSDVFSTKAWFLLAAAVPMAICHQAAAKLAQQQPHWIQWLEMVVVADFMAYWMHRLLHTPRFWRIHAIHHSTEALDWSASLRHHPLEAIVVRLGQFTPLYLLGFDLQMLTILYPWLVAADLFTHSNLSWTYGPLHTVVASPAWHRWHHATDREAVDKNFGVIFSVWDLWFGTFLRPSSPHPQGFGLASGDSPPLALGNHLLYPFQ
ncbi:MAG TPA: sterol desaturase family protein [Candidatus Xenobia bacterium]